jgi:hypothetical protein
MQQACSIEAAAMPQDACFVVARHKSQCGNQAAIMPEEA